MNTPALRLAVVLLLLSAALTLLGVCVGSAGFEDLLGPLLQRQADAEQSALAAQIVWDIRLPRTLGAWTAGALLGLAGAVAQGLFRNPLADPYLLGSASGAALGVALALLAMGGAAGMLGGTMMSAGNTFSVYSGSLLVRLGLTGAAFVGAMLALKPDCVFGFSDLQADIAAELIRHGVQVTVFNQRSVEEIFSMLYQVAAMVGQAEQGLQRITQMQAHLQTIQQATVGFKRRPRVYFEEWDEPPISAIRWVSELISIAGGDDCFPELAVQSLGKHRIISDPMEVVRRQPDIIIGSWCGKKFRPPLVAAREGWATVPAVANQQLFEIKSADILQPGPAALTDGVDQLHRIIMDWGRVYA